MTANTNSQSRSDLRVLAQAVAAVVALVVCLTSGPRALAEAPLSTCEDAPPGWVAPTEDELREGKLVCDFTFDADRAGYAATRQPGTGQAATVQSDAGGNGASILSISTAKIDPPIRVPCWAGWDPCTETYMMPVGTAYGVLTSDNSGTVSVDSWFDGGTADCAEYTDAGGLGNPYDLVVYLDGVWAFNDNEYEGCINFKLYAAEYSTDDCTGTIRRGWYSDELKANPPNSRGVSRAWCDDHAADCAYGSWGDDCDNETTQTDWHMADLLFSDDSSGGATRSYKTLVYARICQDDCSTGCSGWSVQDGCFTAQRY